jgi:hypothetical protein
MFGNSIVIMDTTGGFMFSGHENIFGRAGLLVEEHLTPQDYLDAFKEIENLYKMKYGYKCVRVVRSKTDPLMCDVWVIPNRAYAKTIYWY